MVKLPARLSNVLLVCVILAFWGSCDSYNLPLDKFLNGSSAAADDETAGSAKAITAFTITSPASTGVINEPDKTIAVTVPYGTDVTGLTPNITHTGAGISPASGAARDFTTPVSYTVTAEDGTSQVYTVTVTITVASTLDNVAAVVAWIAAAVAEDPTAGSDTDHAIALPPLDINLTAMDGNGWADLLTTIQSAGKYVSLDLSACTMNGTEFDPGTTNTGEKYVVSLTLPNQAESIKAGTFYTDITFRFFNSLKKVKGENIISVGAYAFTFCPSLTSVSLPKAVTIGNNAFNGCTALTTVSLPEAVTINDYAFSSTALTTVSFPKAETIGSAFASCTALTTVSLPEAVTVNDYAFIHCTSLTTVTLSAFLTSIGTNPFTECVNLTNITIDPANSTYKHSDDKKMLLSKNGTTLIAYPSASGAVTLNGITTIGDEAFDGCTALTSASFPDVETIGHTAFAYCTSLSTADFPEAKTIGSNAFNGCTALTSASLPDVETIGSVAFAGCTSLSTADFPEATTIGSSAFNGCTSLSTADFPETTTIGGNAFYGCTALTSANFPNAETIGSTAFQNTGSTALTVTLGAVVPTLEPILFFAVTGSKPVTVKVPTGAMGYGSSPTDTTTNNWGNAFRGKGWNGTNYLSGTVNSNINLTITTY